MERTKVEPPEGYDGVDVVIGKHIYVAPPMTLRTIRTMYPKIGSLSDPNLPKEASFDILSELVYVALKRNYPAITKDEIEDGIDAKSIGEVMQAILEASGLTRGNVTAATEQPTP